MAYLYHNVLLFKFSWLSLLVYYIIATSESPCLTPEKKQQQYFHEAHIKRMYLPGPNGRIWGPEPYIYYQGAILGLWALLGVEFCPPESWCI